MISRRILAAFALLWAFPCLAQTGSIKTPAQLNSEINTTFPNNTVGQITPAGVRQVALDQVASVPFLNVTNVFTASQSFPNGVIISGGTITGAAWSGGTITGLPTPVNPSDAVTLSYVNSAVTTGINILAPSRLATAAALPNTPTYNNGTAGVGATLTSSANSTLTVDGVVANLNDVVLVKNQGSAFQNGIYTLTTAGSGSAAWILTRVSYFNIASQMKVGSYTFITAGTANANASYTLQSTVVTVGTDALNWALFSSTGTAVTSLDGTSGNISVQTGSLKVVSGQLSSNVLSSRTSAITQNLSTFSAISTLGYAAAGDGGVGTFVKITGNFRDSYTTGASVTSNGGTCTNGTYLGQFFTGGHGVNFQGNITVSGGNAALANILDYGGNGYSVGDVLTVISPVGGCSPQVTISAVSTTLASFTDSVGTKFQYIPNNGYSNPLAFGCKFNWLHATGDGAATDDTACVRDVMAFASFATPNNLNFTDQPFASNIVLFPPGTSLLSTTSTPACSLCGTGIIQPNGVIAQGAGATNTIFKAPDAGITANFWNLCDVNRQLACFGTAIRDIGLTATTSAPTIGGIYMLFSNADQQLEAVRNIQIYDGQYGCFRYNTGFGGAATFTLYNFFCTHQNNDVDAIVINSSGTMFEFQTLIAEGASTSTNAFTLLNGHVHIMGFHTEGIANGFNINAPASSSSLTLEHASGGNGCTSLMTLQSTNSPGNVALFDTYKNGCGTLVIDGQPASPGNRTADVIPANGWVAFNP